MIKAILTSIFNSIFCSCMLLIWNCLLALIFPQSSYFHIKLVFSKTVFQVLGKFLEKSKLYLKITCIIDRDL